MSEIRKGYKETEVGAIPEDWSCNRLDEVSHFRQGFQISRDKQRKKPFDGAIRYLYISDFFTDKNMLYVEDKTDYYHIRKEDICIANTGNTCGKTFRGSEGLLSNNMFKIFINNEIVENDYYWQYLNSELYWKQLKKYFNSAGQPHVGHKNMAALRMPIPSLPEQKRIVEILSTTDDHIEKLDKIIEDYQLLKKAMMKKLLKEGIGHTEFKQTEIGMIPKDWEVVNLGKIGEFKNGVNKGKIDFGFGTKFVNIENCYMDFSIDESSLKLIRN